jgi:cytochrome P450
MVEAVPGTDVSALPLAPPNPLPYLQQLKVIRTYHTGTEVLRAAGGTVTRITLAPSWITPPLVLVCSPQGAHDVLGRTDGLVDKALPIFDEIRRVLGGNLFTFNHDAWMPRRRTLQPIFTKKHVAQFATHMAQAAERLPDHWADGAEVDLDAEVHALTLRALGRSILGLNLDERADAVGPAVRTALKYCADRGVRPFRAPAWLPTPARRRARAASATVHRLAAEILATCRADETVDAPLVHALMAAKDPETGQPLSDGQICDELVLFMLAGHDTTATALTYAFWALGRHPQLQDRVAAEVAELGDRLLTPADVPRLPFTRQVLQEALRLCPPAPTNPRMVMADIAVDGFRVPRGTVAIIGIYAMNRDPALWDDPLTFDPERFSPQHCKGRGRWQFLPFGGGPRSCIGEHFAMLEATLGLAAVIRRVEIRSLDEDFPLAVPFTMVAGAPIRARVQTRTGTS